jgi:hypothetical protein
LINDRYGWETAPEDETTNYINKLKLFITDDILFSNFRRDPDYGKILSGDPYVVGEDAIFNLKAINELDNYLTNKSEIIRNNLIGNPLIYDYPEIGEDNPSTLMYYYTTLTIKNLLNDYKPKKIVEIGGGYGGLCRLISSFIGFDEYIIIDLPDVINLTKKYLDNYPELSNKITYISCENLNTLIPIHNVDLTIANSSLAELDHTTQKLYINKAFKDTKFAHVIWNTNHILNKIKEMNYFINSFDKTKYKIKNNITHGNISNILIKPL